MVRTDDRRRSDLLSRPIMLSGGDRVLAGLAGGLAARTGIASSYIRVAFFVLSLAGGFGVLCYLALWGLAVPADRSLVARPARPDQAVALLLVVLGTLLLLRGLGVWFGDAVVWPVALAATGSAVIWSRSDEHSRTGWSRLLGRLPGLPALLVDGRVPVLRLALGGVLLLAGMAAFLAANDALAAARDVLLAVVVTLAGLVIVAGPWLFRLINQLTAERRARIRSQERSEMAAHLHDSVLQTLALIQRSESPRDMATLARGQERELRAWLYGGARADRPGSLQAGLEALAARIEERHLVAVELVTVGDAQVDERLQALLEATGEALTNAARHAGVRYVSLYAEVEREAVNIFVSDQGKGFDVAAVPTDRRGLVDSVHGRVHRHGGWVEVTSEPGEGTEVRLCMPRSAS